MTVRLHLDRSTKARHGPLRWLEYLLLFAGLVAVDTYIWMDADTVLQQAYDNWSLDRQMQHQSSGLRDFAAAELHWPSPASEPQAPAKPEPAAPNGGTSAQPEKPKRLAEFALIGRIEVPRLGLKATVREGVGARTLSTAVGHMPSTPLPGELGNAALAAHRDTLFRKLRDIRMNDLIAFETPERRYEYVVESLRIVNPANLSVLAAAKNDRVLTLITCYPFNFIGAAPERFIVKARQVEASARTAPVPYPTKS